MVFQVHRGGSNPLSSLFPSCPDAGGLSSLWTGPTRSILRNSVLSLRELRKWPEMVTISFLALLLPAKQGKHLPRSILQGTVAPGQASTGAGV